MVWVTGMVLFANGYDCAKGPAAWCYQHEVHLMVDPIMKKYLELDYLARE